MKLRTVKNWSGVWLLALLLNLFSVAAASPKPKSMPIGMVYRPLTKKFQPVKAPKTTLKAMICADSQRKHEFETAFMAFGAATSARSDANFFEELVFGFFEKGVAAILSVPFRPQTPDRETRKFEEPLLLGGDQPRPDAESAVITDANSDRFSEQGFSRETLAIPARSQSFISTIIDRRRVPRAPPVIL